MPALHLVRHGRTTWQDEGRVQGQAEGPVLTELGREQVAAAAEELRLRVGPRPLLVASDLTRARQSAQVLQGVLGASVTYDERLREQHLGRMEGRLSRELTGETTPDGIDVSEVRWAGGESVRDLHARAADWLAGLGPGEVVTVTHEHTIRALLAVLDGRDHRSLDWDLPIPPGSVITREV